MGPRNVNIHSGENGNITAVPPRGEQQEVGTEVTREHAQCLKGAVTTLSCQLFWNENLMRLGSPVFQEELKICIVT